MRSAPLITKLRLTCLILVIGASGCAQMQAQPHTAPHAHTAEAHVTLQGQLSIKLHAWQNLPAKGVSLGFFFSGNSERGLLDLMTPLGTLMAQVGWSEREAWTTNQDGKLSYGNLDELSTATLGEALPLLSLTHWMTGQPDPMQASTNTDITGVFEQAGWRIDTRQYSDLRIQATREASSSQRGIHIKVYLDR